MAPHSRDEYEKGEEGEEEAIGKLGGEAAQVIVAHPLRERLGRARRPRVGDCKPTQSYSSQY